MKRTFLLIFNIGFSIVLHAQNIITLPYENPEGITWANNEKEYYSERLETEVVTNVSVPTMEVFKPADSIATGTAVIIAPGGGMFIHSINSEGRDVAKWLNKRGITAFVLKYRLVPTGEDGVTEILGLMNNNYQLFIAKVSQIMPLAVNDGMTAVAYIREHAEEYGILKNKIGLIGFSAGGSVTLGVAYYFKEKSRPDFIAALYPGTTLIPTQKPRDDTPPLFIAAAENDQLGLAAPSVQIYNDWFNMGLKAELHIYSEGGHGFGMRKQDLPSDKWIDRYYEWAIGEGFIVPK
jgi:dienelactone hydrolase